VLSSLGLTVVCLAAATVLVFIGTLAQTNQGLYAVQANYFQSLVVFHTFEGAGLRIPVWPGGYLIGAVLLMNLVAAQVRRFRSGRDRPGFWLVHLGLILLLLGQLATDLLQVGSSMRLREGDSKNYSEDQRRYELAVVSPASPDQDQVVAIPESWLTPRREIQLPALSFKVRVEQYWQNSTALPSSGASVSGPASPASGAPSPLVFHAAPLVTSSDRRNVPTATVELVAQDGSLGAWQVSAWSDQPRTVVYQGQTYRLSLRPVRYYKAFSLELLDFIHEKHAGTDIPKRFSSRLRLRRADTGEDREVLVYMNNPLRYGGETFYQSGYDERDDKVTILQVVRNPGWLTPYVSCALISLGLAVQFLGRLVAFVRRRDA
jgi:hypothetical protein